MKIESSQKFVEIFEEYKRSPEQLTPDEELLLERMMEYGREPSMCIMNAGDYRVSAEVFGVVERARAKGISAAIVHLRGQHVTWGEWSSNAWSISALVTRRELGPPPSNIAIRLENGKHLIDAKFNPWYSFKAQAK